jgi:hypothetical protein
MASSPPLQAAFGRLFLSSRFDPEKLHLPARRLRHSKKYPTQRTALIAQK